MYRKNPKWWDYPLFMIIIIPAAVIAAGIMFISRFKDD